MWVPTSVGSPLDLLRSDQGAGRFGAPLSGRPNLKQKGWIMNFLAAAAVFLLVVIALLGFIGAYFWLVETAEKIYRERQAQLASIRARRM